MSAKAEDAAAPSTATPNGDRQGFKEKLQDLPCFQGLEVDVFAAIELELERIYLPGGQALFNEGEEANALYFLIFGRLGAYMREPSGEDREIAQIHAGEVFGEMALISGEPRTATVVAIRDSELLRLARSAFDRLVARYPSLMASVARQVVARLRQANMRTATDDAARTFLVWPHDPTIDGFTFAHDLADALAEQGQRVRCLTSHAADQSIEWFHRIEEAHDRLVYLGDFAHRGWTQRCIRQVDKVLHVASARNLPTDYEPRELPAMGKQLQSQELIVLQPSDTKLPATTAAWLDRLDVGHHTHVRADNKEDLLRLARLLTGRAVGVVFSGGGARGIAHVGVIRALRQAGIPIDLAGGTSMGAIAAAGAALEWSDPHLEEMIKRTVGEKNPFIDFTVPMISLVRGRKVSNLLRAAFADINVENMWRSYFCVSTNLTTGRSQAHRRGPLWRAIRASIAIPGLLPPVVEDGQILVDGGIIDNLPADIMKSQRRGPVIGVDVGRDLGLAASAAELDDRSLWWLLRHSRSQVPGIGSLLMRSATVSSDAQYLAQKSQLDLLLAPDLESYYFLDWKGYDDAFEKGFNSTMKALEQLDDSLLKTLSGSLSGKI